MNAVGTAVVAAATVLTGLRWLRVAQREHYLAGSVGRFARRWLVSSPPNALLGVLGVANLALGLARWESLLVAAVILVVWPLGLGVRGRTSPLAWTSRLRRLAAVTMGLAATVVGAFALLGQVTLGVVLVAALAPLLVDAALLATRPIETRLLAPFVREAERRLTQVAPRVVAITGSFGKTSTKSYLRGLLADRFEVCPSPASFNNRAGLARAINEHLHPGAEVFIAEMGTYGRGEIRDLCEWVTPEVGVITSIGPVHLERMGTLETIVLAKREILERARVAVLNVDDPLLAALAEEVTATGMPVIRCGSRGDDLHVAVRVLERTDDRTRVAITTTDGAESASVEATAPDGGLQLTNLACAIGAARGLGATDLDLPAGIGRLHNPDHRQVVERGPSGVLVIDDSYNANPTGVQSALNRLAELDVTGRRVVVTPGMVELGARQGEENQRFAHDAGAVADVVLVVGRTNREALLDGLDGGSAEVHWFPTREAATRWVGDQLGAGDAVLYENDLPDHYP